MHCLHTREVLFTNHDPSWERSRLGLFSRRARLERRARARRRHGGEGDVQLVRARGFFFARVARRAMGGEEASRGGGAGEMKRVAGSSERARAAM